MTDDRFERELREFLVSRAPVGASPALRAGLVAVANEGSHAPRWRTRSVGAWRAVAGLAAAATIAVLVLAVLSGIGRTWVRDPDTVGGPSNAPVPSGSPFVTAPSGFFTAAALADAQERLGRVFAATGIEAAFVVQPTPGLEELSASPPEDRDGDPRRDITAVVGVTPSGRIVCCITITGATIDLARERYYWQPLDQPGALDDELAAATPEERDAALRGFVRGVEDLALAIGELGIGSDGADMIRAVIPVTIIVAVLFLAVVALRRRKFLPAAVGTPDKPTASIAIPDASGPSRVDAESVLMPVDAPGTSPTPAEVAPSDRRLVLLASVALLGLALIGVVDVFRSADPGVPLDPARETIGIARPGFPVVPALLAGTALVALVMYAVRGDRWRRLGVSALVALLAGSGWLALDMTRPAGRDTDIGWVSSPNGTVTSQALGGLREQLTFEVAPGETFTFAGIVGNRGPLPLTILGLDGVQPTAPNPYVAAIVGLAWVPQPVDGGPVMLLSAAAEGASTAWPITLSPGEEAAIVVVGRAGVCAEPGASGPVLPLLDYRLTYRVLGIERSQEVGLAADLFVPAKTTCTVAVPGGTITYGPRS